MSIALDCMILYKTDTYERTLSNKTLPASGVMLQILVARHWAVVTTPWRLARLKSCRSMAVHYPKSLPVDRL